METKEVTLILAIIFLVTAWLAVSLRCYVRIKMLHSWGMDDWWMLLTLALFTILTSFIVKATQLDLNVEGVALLQVISVALKYDTLAGLVYIGTACTLKVSIALLLLRIMQERVYIQLLRGSIGFICIYSLIYFIVTLVECFPVSYAWDFVSQSGTCMSNQKRASIAYTFSAIAITTDWFYAILPIFVIWTLRMNRLLKFYLSLVLGLGALACIATIIRLTYIVQIAKLMDLPSEKVFTNEIPKVFIWTMAELGVGIFAACVVTLKPLLQYVKILGAIDNSEGSATDRSRTRSSRKEMSQTQDEQSRRDPTLGSTNEGSIDGGSYEL